MVLRPLGAADLRITAKPVAIKFPILNSRLCSIRKVFNGSAQIKQKPSVYFQYYLILIILPSIFSQFP